MDINSLKEAAKSIDIIVHKDMRMPVDVLDYIESKTLVAMSKLFIDENDFKSYMLLRKFTHISFYKLYEDVLRFAPLTDDEFNRKIL